MKRRDMEKYVEMFGNITKAAVRIRELEAHNEYLNRENERLGRYVEILLKESTK